MLELFEFQRQASQTIIDRFMEYVPDPIEIGTRSTRRTVPFFQALQAITASGKTAILADAIAGISALLDPAPVVLWLSKGRVVVEQTYANLLPGGKYHHLIDGFDVQAIAEYSADDAKRSSRPCIYFATVGTFNIADREAGNRLIYRCDIDDQDQSTWAALRSRQTDNDSRRPLIVVYDEAHNLTDQQTELLMELQPDAFLLASATMKLPARLGQVVAELKGHGKTNEWLITSVDARAVADAGLIKSTVSLAGYNAPMDQTLGALLADFTRASADAKRVGLEGLPKAIYVANTNIVESNAFHKDDPRQPFFQRQAPPIVIWRYLTEVGKIPASEIAVYCSLSFVKDFPPPSDFVHFKGGEKDYDTFVRGIYRHVIFNLSLQEGWDDPLAYFAYVDKSMESRVQVEQVIGRLLRQPGVRRYSSDRLNTASFFVRVDRGEVFNDLITEVGKKLRTEAPEIRLISKGPGKRPLEEFQPRATRVVPTTAYKPDRALDPIQKALDSLTDYSQDNVNTRAVGSRRIVKQEVGEDQSAGKWENFAYASMVSARWIFQREVLRRFRRALEVASTSDPKFDARMAIGSRAYDHVVLIASQVVEVYLQNVYVVQKSADPYEVGSVICDPEQMEIFAHALHEGYDRLNTLELRFAKAVDEVGLPWCRNPSQSGYGLPLITAGTTRTFYPDFLIWKDDDVYAIDTKGAQTLPDGATRKLLRIEPPRQGNTRLYFRFVSEGTWDPDALTQRNKDGFTRWGVRQDGVRNARHFESIDDAVADALDPQD
jgi:type III restriction enzyme